MMKQWLTLLSARLRRKLLGQEWRNQPSQQSILNDADAAIDAIWRLRRSALWLADDNDVAHSLNRRLAGLPPGARAAEFRRSAHSGSGEAE